MDCVANCMDQLRKGRPSEETEWKTKPRVEGGRQSRRKWGVISFGGYPCKVPCFVVGQPAVTNFQIVSDSASESQVQR